MKIFLDTANLDEIREAASLGVPDGVTTNPSLIAAEAAKAGADVATMPYKVFAMLWKHPRTDKGQEQFLKDWEKAQAR